MSKNKSETSPSWPRRNTVQPRIVESTVGIFEDLFVPNARHREDERNRLEWSRQDEGSSDPHHGPIDLDSGVVKIQAPATPADPSA